LLAGYVSDEYYQAIADAQVEFRRQGRGYVTRSAPSGAIEAEIEPGEYDVVLAKAGFGSKTVRAVHIGSDEPRQFRLLSDRMLGMAWPQSVKAGEAVSYRTHSVEPFKLTLWRYGLERRLVRKLGWLDDHGPRAMAQILPDRSFTETGVEWFGGNMAVHAQVFPAPEETGLYYLQMKGESGAYFSFPVVVAPKQPQTQLAVLANTNTWNAYNAFGGRSNYVQVKGLAATPTVNARQDLRRYFMGDYGEWKAGHTAPLSFIRPNRWNSVAENDEVTDPIEGRVACGVAPAEWRTLGWLEREGFSYDLYSDHHLHSGDLPLDEYGALLLHVHPEYWSIEAFRRVQNWVKRGGRLIYLGGNGMNGPVEFLDCATMLCRNWWSDRSESRMHEAAESEASLVGVVFSDPGAMTAAPYRVEKADHWVFEGTGLRNGDTFGEKTLHERCSGGASGHETDKISASSPPETVLLAKGLNPDNGGAEMVCCELAGGGLVFSAGSITFAPALLVDEACSRITANVLRRFLAC
jgi:N,N-dimethylformamidase